MITGINESKTLKNHITCDGRKCNSNQKWNNDFSASVKIKKKTCARKRLYLECCYMYLRKWYVFSKYY